MTHKQEMNLTSYWFEFDATGVECIDRILSAVAEAGNRGHHTHSWQDEEIPPAGHVGDSPEEWIQNAANDAAKAILSGQK